MTRSIAANPSANTTATVGPSDTSPTLSGESEGIHRWTFSRREDVDFDGWPEGWQRKKDRQHPAYLGIRIAPRDVSQLQFGQAVDFRLLQAWPTLQHAFPTLPSLPPSIADNIADRYFRMELNGGWAMVQSPPITVDSLYRYRLQLSAMTESLVFDSAYAELLFLDAKGNLVTQYETKSLTGTSPWTSLSTELVSVPELAAFVAVRLLLRPMKTPGEADIRGAAGFDDIKIQEFPQIRVTTDKRLAVYDQGEKPIITVRVLGMKRNAEDVKFVVRDITGQQIASQAVAFEEVKKGSAQTVPTVPHSIEGVAVLELPALGPGFYVVQSMLGDFDNSLLSNETTLAILADLPQSKNANPYGWTLPKGVESNTEIKRIPDWLVRLGVGVVKYPCWFAPEDQAQLESAAWLAGRLNDKNIRVIGLLDTPPASVQEKIDERERREPDAVNLFRDPTVWQPLLEPIMTPMSLKVRTWQLGKDTDYSFTSSPRLKQSIREIGRELQGFGQPVGIAFSWPWLESLPPASEQSWSAINLSNVGQPLSADELEAYLEASENVENVPRERAETWVTLDPLNASAYDLQTRITDLVIRMTAVRGYRVPAAFVSEPLHPAQGLLRPDWRPGELLLPWRTTATLIGDLTKTGSVPLPNKSSNVVLSNKAQTSIVIWNPTPTTELLYLGDAVRQVDVWGNSTIPKKVVVDGQLMHVFNVGPLPSFIVDTDPVLVAFRMSTRLLETRLDSLLGRRQTVSIEFRNPTDETLSGEVRMRPLDDWEVDLPPQPFDLAAGRSAKHSFEVSLRNSAKIGDTQLQFDFLMSSQPQRKFSVIRPIHVGPEGLDIEVTTRLQDDELLVELTMINRSEKPQAYDCMLFPPPGTRYQYQRRQITIPAGATVKRIFPWSGGNLLVGQQMLLRASEQGGDRVLNQTVPITP